MPKHYVLSNFYLFYFYFYPWDKWGRRNKDIRCIGVTESGIGDRDTRNLTV